MLSCEHCIGGMRDAFATTQTAVRNAGNLVWEKAACRSVVMPRLSRLFAPLEEMACCSCCHCGCMQREKDSKIVTVQPIAAASSIEKLDNNNFIIECSDGYHQNDNMSECVGPMDVCDGSCGIGAGANVVTINEGGNSVSGVLLLPVAENTTPILSIGIPVEIKPTHTNGNGATTATTAGAATTAEDGISTHSTAPSVASVRQAERINNAMGEELPPRTGTPIAITESNDDIQNSSNTPKGASTQLEQTENEMRAALQKQASVQSRAESIKTQLDEDDDDRQHNEVEEVVGEVVNDSATRTPSLASRTQSTKSLVIEEQLDDVTDGADGGGDGGGDDGVGGAATRGSSRNSFVVVEDVLDHDYTTATPLGESTSSRGSLSSASPLKSRHISMSHAAAVGAKSTAEHDEADDAEVARPTSPTIAELKALSRRNSMVKSLESLYDRRPNSKTDSLDNTTESCSSACSQPLTAMALQSLPLKPEHTPLKQKAKTTHFLKRDRRRVSPVKQSIKMVQAELYPPTMTRFERPREALLKTFDQLDSPNWEVIITGLKSMVRLMRYHPENLENQMHMVCIQLTRSVRNLRSQVARAACQASTELFTLKSKYLEQECDDLICALLHRTADTNRFLRADAMRALESMCDHLTPAKVLNLLTTKGALHQNAVVRTTAAKMLNRLVERLGSERVFAMTRENRDKFFVTGANLLLEGSLETRSYAKSLFRMLSEHQHYNRLVMEIIPARTYRNVEKTLKSIR